MAKSARASRIKANKSKLRENVHRPVENARLQRLSEKLLAIASTNMKMETLSGLVPMEVGEKGDTDTVTEQEQTEAAMEIDQGPKIGKSEKRRLADDKVRKRQRHGKSKHSVIFQTLKKGDRGRARSGRLGLKKKV